MINTNEQTPYDGPEKLSDFLNDLACLLNFYSLALSMLLLGFCTAAANLAATFCTRIAAKIADDVSDCLFAISTRLQRERERSAVVLARYVPVCLLWLLVIAFDLLADWSTLGWSFFARFPLSLPVFAVITIAEACLAARWATLQSGARAVSHLRVEVATMSAEIEHWAPGGAD